jgi:hypothetical protein
MQTEYERTFDLGKTVNPRAGAPQSSGFDRRQAGRETLHLVLDHIDHRRQAGVKARAMAPGKSEPTVTRSPSSPQCRPRSGRRPDQAQVQVPAHRTPADALDPLRGNVRIAGPDDPQPPAGPGRCAPSAPTARCSGPAWLPTRTRPGRPARRGRPGRRARTCTRWTAGRRGRAGTGPGSAPTRSPRCSRVSLLRRATRSGPPSLLSQFLSHSPPSGAVHQWPPQSWSGRSRTVADLGERWCALLESVLGATPREFESRILRHADLLKHRSSALTG